MNIKLKATLITLGIFLLIIGFFVATVVYPIFIAGSLIVAFVVAGIVALWGTIYEYLTRS